MKTILVLGGRGFLGRYVVEELSKKYTVYTFDQRVGGDTHRQGSILEVEDLIVASRDVDVIINLVGLTPLKAPSKVTYHQIHVQGVKNIITAAHENKLKRIIHISAMGADPKSTNAYLRTKGEAESLLKAQDIPVTMFAPSLLYADHGVLMTTLKSPAIPRIPAKFSPIHAADVAHYIQLAVAGRIKQDRLELGGPEDLTLWQMATRVKKYHLPVPHFVVRLAVKIASSFELFGMTQDQVKNLTLDNTLHDVRSFDYFKPRRFMTP